MPQHDGIGEVQLDKKKLSRLIHDSCEVVVGADCGHAQGEFAQDERASGAELRIAGGENEARQWIFGVRNALLRVLGRTGASAWPARPERGRASVRR